MDEAELGGFLDLAYGAAAQAALWPDVLERFADMVGAEGAALIWQDQATRRGRGIVTQVDPEVLPAYFANFARRHPSQRWTENPAERLRHFVPKMIADDEALPKAELMRTAFYNEFMRPFGLHSVMRLGLSAQGLDAAVLVLSRPASRERFEGRDLELMTALHPHVIRAFNLAQALGRDRPLAAAAEGVFDGSGAAMLVVDRLGRVLRANAAAEAHLAARAGLRAAAGRLSAPTVAQGSRLAALVAQAASDDAAVRRGASMALASPSRRLPFSITVTPLGGELSPIVRTPRAALVTISDLEADVDLPQLRLRETFGLTRTEAKVASAIVDGETPREAAERLGISFNTVRGHLARTFEKTGVRRQAELVRLLARLS